MATGGARWSLCRLVVPHLNAHEGRAYHCCTAPKSVCKLATPCCTASTRGVHIIAALHRKVRASWPLHAALHPQGVCISLLHCTEKGVQVGHSMLHCIYKGCAYRCCTAPKRACKLATPCCTASTRGVHIVAALHRKGRASWPLYCCTVSRRTCKLSGSIENETMMRGNVTLHYEIDLLELKKTCDVLYLEKNSCTITDY